MRVDEGVDFLVAVLDGDDGAGGEGRVPASFRGPDESGLRHML